MCVITFCRRSSGSVQAPRAELLRVLMFPDLEVADRIGELWGNPKTRPLAELDCE